MSTDPTAGTTGQTAPATSLLQLSAAQLYDELQAARQELDKGIRNAANLAAENARLRQERNNYGAQIDELLAQSRPIESLIVQVVEAQGMLAKTGHAATPSSVPGVRDAYGRLTRIADGLRDVLGAIHGQKPDDARDCPGFAPSATETAPQTVPGVTGHTEPSTAPSEAYRGRERAYRAGVGRCTVHQPSVGCEGKRPDCHVVLAELHPSAVNPQPVYSANWEGVPVTRGRMSPSPDVTLTLDNSASTHEAPAEPSGEGAALIAATEQDEQRIADDPETLNVDEAQRDAWERTARTLARKVDERPGHNDDCGSCCCCSIDTDRLRADLATLKQAAGMPDAETSLVADAIRGMLDASKTLRTQIRPQLARAEADAAEARRELAEARAETARVRADLEHVRAGAELVEAKRAAQANAEALAASGLALNAAEEKARNLEQQLAEVRADLSATYKLGNESIREHTALILGVQAIAERIEQYADANDPGAIVYARDLRALTQPTTQPEGESNG